MCAYGWGRYEMEREKGTRRRFLKAAVGGVVTGSGVSCAGLSLRRRRSVDVGAPRSPMAMPIRTLGTTDIPVSFLGFAVFANRDKALYRRAADLGITYFHSVVDSATRKQLGSDEYNVDAFSALRPMRDRLVISHMTVKRDTKGDLRHDLDEYLRQSRFGHLDIWYICCPVGGQLDDFVEVFEEVRKAGKVRASALSTHQLAKDVPKVIAPGSSIDGVMMTYNYTVPADHKEWLAKLHDAGKGVVAMKGMAGRFYTKTGEKAGPLVRWLLAEPRLSTVPVGMETVEELEENVAALEHSLSDEDRKALERQMAYASPRFCRTCGACDGRCPKGLAISDHVRVAMYAEGYDNPTLAREQFAAIPAAARNVSCDDCERCAVRCPNGVAVRNRVTRARTIAEA